MKITKKSNLQILQILWILQNSIRKNSIANVVLAVLLEVN